MGPLKHARYRYITIVHGWLLMSMPKCIVQQISHFALCEAFLPRGRLAWRQTWRTNKGRHRGRCVLLEMTFDHFRAIDERASVLFGLVEQQYVLPMILELPHALFCQIPLFREPWLIDGFVMSDIKRYIFECVGGVLQPIVSSVRHCVIRMASNIPLPLRPAY